MKRRDYKNFNSNSIYHIYNRGNNKEKIFFDDQDYRAFLFRLGLAMGIKTEDLNTNKFTYLPKSRIRLKKFEEDFKIHSFCLMPNHFHILIEQCSDTPVSKFIHTVCTSFSMYINKKYARVGHIFQDRFKSVIIESSEQFIWTVSYIHTNPVKDGLVSNPKEYKWSSYNDFIDKQNTLITNKGLVLSSFGSKENFIEQNTKMGDSVKDVP